MSSTPLAPNTSLAQPGADHDTPQAVVERFLAANDALDVDGMFSEIAPDATWAFPTAPAGAPAEVIGKTNNRAFFEALRPVWTAFRLTRREVRPLAGDPERVIAHYASEGTSSTAAPTPTPTSASSASATGRSCTGPSSATPPPFLRRSLRSEHTSSRHSTARVMGRARPTSLARRTPLAHQRATRHALPRPAVICSAYGSAKLTLRSSFYVDGGRRLGAGSRGRHPAIPSSRSVAAGRRPSR